jgi:basic membrane protein A
MLPFVRGRSVWGALAGAVIVAMLAGVAPGAPEASNQAPRRAVLITDSCSGGAGFLCTPFKQVLRRTGVSGRIISPDFREDFEATLSLLAKQYALVIMWPGNDFERRTRALAKVAPRYPDARFAVIETPLSAVRGRPRNVQSVNIRTHEASYLAGWLATRLEQRRPGRDVVAAVGGFKGFPLVEDFIVGFRAGAKAASAKVNVLVSYSNDFADPTKCEAIARSQIARGAGVVFNVAGGCGLGALLAAKRARVWGIGVDTDQSHLGPHILTSVVKRFDVLLFELLDQVRSKRIRGRSQTELGLARDGAGLGRISARVPASLRSELDDVRRRIIAGRIRVPGVPPS